MRDDAMSDIANHPLSPSIARILNVMNEVVGIGFLAPDGSVCTCAHVVEDALGISGVAYAAAPPTGEVRLDFPFCGGSERTAFCRPDGWLPIERPAGGGDVAVLKLTTDPPTAARPARLLPVSRLAGRRFEVFGVPAGADEGRFAYGILRDSLSNTWVQMEDDDGRGIRVQRGFSGTPVWDPVRFGVVGMVVAVHKEPTERVAFLLPNNVLYQACRSIQPIVSARPFAPLTNGLAGVPGSPLGGVEQFLREYVGTLDAPAPFGGREAALEQLNQWLKQPDPSFALLVADAGRGKSALLAHWCMQLAVQGQVEVAFVPVSIRFGTSLKSRAFAALWGRLRYLRSGGADGAAPNTSDEWQSEIEACLYEDHPADRPLVVVLDGVDEATGWECGVDLRFPAQLGRGVKVLVSARPLAGRNAAGWLEQLSWRGVATLVTLPRLKRRGVAEVLRALGDQEARLAAQPDMVTELLRLSRGDPLLVRLYTETLAGRITGTTVMSADDLRHLNPGLDSYFERWWQDQRRAWGWATPLKEAAVLSLFSLLACALGPLHTADLVVLGSEEGLNTFIIDDVVQPLSRFVVGDGREQGYVFSHPLLNQHFYEKLSTDERKKWDDRFIEYGEESLRRVEDGRITPSNIPGYVLRYLGAHLERAGSKAPAFRRLVSESWLQAWDAAEGSYDGFLSDVERAWQRADLAIRDVLRNGPSRPDDIGELVGWQCRYALIKASINSTVGGIPPAVLARLVATGRWTTHRALGYAQRLPDDDLRAEALAALTPMLSEPQVRQAIASSQEIPADRLRSVPLARLASRLVELGNVEEALELTRGIVPDGASRALKELAVRLAVAGRVDAGLELAESMGNESEGGEALAGIAPHLPARLLARSVAAARMTLGTEEWEKRRFGDAEVDTERIIRAGEALASVWELDYGEWRRRLLVGDDFEDAFAEDRHILHAWSFWTARWIRVEEARGQALAALIRRIAELRSPQAALETARSVSEAGQRARALAAVAACLGPIDGENIAAEALDAAKELRRERAQARALVSLVRSLSERWQREVLSTARAILDGGWREAALTKLVPHLADVLLEDAFAAAQELHDDRIRARALAGLGPYVPGRLLPSVLAAARQIADERWREVALAYLAPKLAESGNLDQGLSLAESVEHPISRAVALVGLAPHLPAALRHKPLEALLQEKMPSRGSALVELAPYIPDELLDQAWTAALNEYDRLNRSGFEALVSLTPRVPDASLASLRLITDDALRAAALVRVASHLSPSDQVPLIEAALSRMREIAEKASEDKPVADTLISLAPVVPDALVMRALELARRCRDPSARAATLAAFAARLPDPEQKAVWEEIIATAREIKNDSERARLFMDLISKVPASHEFDGLLDAAFEVIFEAAAAANDSFLPWDKVARSLAERGFERESLSIVRWRLYGRERAAMLIELAPRLPRSFMPRLLAIARGIQSLVFDPKETRTENERARAFALAGLAPMLSGVLLERALVIARGFADSAARAEALGALGAQLSGEQQTDVLLEATTAARAIQVGPGGSMMRGGLERWLTESHKDATEKARVLACLAARVPSAQHHELLYEAKAAAEYIYNESGDEQATAGILVQMAKLGFFEDALREARVLERDLGTGGKSDGTILAEALTAIARYVPDNLLASVLDETIAAARRTSRAEERAWLLHAITLDPQRLPINDLYALWYRRLRSLASCTRPDVIRDLSMDEHIRILAVLGGKSALLETAQAIVELGRWFP